MLVRLCRIEQSPDRFWMFFFSRYLVCWFRSPSCSGVEKIALHRKCSFAPDPFVHFINNFHRLSNCPLCIQCCKSFFSNSSPSSPRLPVPYTCLQTLWCAFSHGGYASRAFAFVLCGFFAVTVLQQFLQISAVFLQHLSRDSRALSSRLRLPVYN